MSARPTARPSSRTLAGSALLAASLVAAPARAATFDVGAGFTYPTLRAAIDAANLASASGPHEIVVHSESYDSAVGDLVYQGGEGPCSTNPMPPITFDGTIRSTGGASATDAIGPLLFLGDNTIQGFTMYAGMGFEQSPFGGTPNVRCLGPVHLGSGTFVGRDLAISDGPYASESYGLVSYLAESVLLEDVRFQSIDSDAVHIEGYFDLHGPVTFRNVEFRSEQASIDSVPEVLFESVTFEGSGARLTGTDGVWMIRDSVFRRTDNRAATFSSRYGIEVDIVGSLFDRDDAEGMAGITFENYDWDQMQRIRIRDTEFRSLGDEAGGAIYFDAKYGRLEVHDSQFVDNNSALGGAIFSNGITVVTGSTFEGQGGERRAYYGGAIAAENNDLHIEGCTFSGLAAEVGGAISYTGHTELRGHRFTVKDTSFTDVSAGVGGAISVEDAADVRLENVTATGAYADGMGGFVSLGYAQPLFAPYSFYGVNLWATGLDVQDVYAGLGGGVFSILDGANDVTVEKSTFLDVGAEYLAPTRITTYSGFGGVAWLDQEDSFRLIDSTVTSASAGTGGIVYSGRNQFDSNALEDASDLCDINFDTRDGNQIELNGVSATDIEAEEAPAVFAYLDDVLKVHASTFSDLLAYGGNSGAISAWGANSIDLTCSSFCGVDAELGALAAATPADYLGSEGGGELRIPRYTAKNNTFVDSEGDGSLFFAVCPNFELGAFGGEGAVTVPPERGLIDVQFNSFVGSGGTDGVIHGSTWDVPLVVANNAFDGADVGVALFDSLYVSGGFNGWNAITLIGAEEAATYFPADTDITSGVSFANAECGAVYPAGALVDAADPAYFDTYDESRADIGFTGGPGSCVPDLDDDGVVAILDCDDEVASISPLAREVPYDDIDQDCDGADLCDVDADGFFSDHLNCGGPDCDDARSDIAPTETDVPYDGIDQDCDGSDLCDVDDDGHDAPACGGHDCDDDDEDRFPGATELAGDAIDSDCDGNPEPVEGPCDDDEDGVIAEACGGIDCNDADATIRPGAEDVPYDGIDQDCSGEDNCDADRDGYIAGNPECGGDDCDDNDPLAHPGGTEILDDGIDQDCDGEDRSLWVQGGASCANCSGANTTAMPWTSAWFGAMALAFLRRRRG